MSANTSSAETSISPWMAPLTPEAREAVRRNVAQAPPLSDRQRERLRLLFRSKAGRWCCVTDPRDDDAAAGFSTAAAGTTNRGAAR